MRALVAQKPLEPSLFQQSTATFVPIGPFARIIVHMHARLRSIAIGLLAGLAFNAATVIAWTGPTASAPNNNAGAPVNVGSTAQVKNGDLGINNVSVFGNALLSGLGVGTGRYLNFDYTSGGTSGTGSSGYGIRDNAGTLEFKNSGGSWASLTSAGYWSASGGNIYNSNVGNVGIGKPNPSVNLEVTGNSNPTIAISTGVSNTDTRLNFWTPDRSWYIVNDGDGSLGSDDALVFVDSTAGAAARMTIATNGNVGIGTSNPTQKLHVNGTVLATAFLYSSDARLKKDITPLDEGLVTLMKLTPVSFTWNDKSPQAGQNDIGFIAQEVEKVVPQVVHTDSVGMKSIDYPKLAPILVNAIQQQEQKIDQQQRQIDELRGELQAMRSTQ